MPSSAFSHTRRSEAGFSLIELSILLAVIAIIAVGMLAWVTPPTIDEAERIRVTVERMRTIQQALVSYRASFGRLPCPARRSLIEDDPKNGEEDCRGIDNAVEAGEGAAVTCGARFNATRKNVGVVPARTLGLGLSVMVDGWGRRFSYHVAEDICPMDAVAGSSINCTSTTYANNPGNIEIRTTNLAGGMTVVADTTPVPGNPPSGAVFVLLSHGQNGSCGWLPSGVQKPAFWNPAPSSLTPANPTVASDGEAENVDQTDGAVSVYWKDTYSQTFDDMVLYQTKEQLDSAVKDPDNYLLTIQECRDLAVMLRNFTPANGTWLNTAGNWHTGGVAWHTPDTNANGVLRVLWYMQEICARYYPEDYNGDGFDQNNVALADTRGCGSGGRVYDFTSQGCICLAPNPTWNGTNCVP